MSEIDAALEMYRRSHSEVATYTVYLSPDIATPKHGEMLIKSGMRYEDARTMMESLNERRECKSFGCPIYGIRLENPEEALAAVRRASADFWAKREARP